MMTVPTALEIAAVAWVAVCTVCVWRSFRCIHCRANRLHGRADRIHRRIDNFDRHDSVAELTRLLREDIKAIEADIAKIVMRHSGSERYSLSSIAGEAVRLRVSEPDDGKTITGLPHKSYRIPGKA
jgi:phage tail sheath gpL-like